MDCFSSGESIQAAFVRSQHYTSLPMRKDMAPNSFWLEEDIVLAMKRRSQIASEEESATGGGPVQHSDA